MKKLTYTGKVAIFQGGVADHKVHLFDNIQEAQAFVDQVNQTRFEQGLENIEQGNTVVNTPGTWSYFGYEDPTITKDTAFEELYPILGKEAENIEEHFQELVSSQADLVREEGYQQCVSCGSWKDKSEFCGEENESREGGIWVCDECWAEGC